MLEDMVKFVIPTTGSITDRLREDWQLIDVMQELNWDKYDHQGLTETIFNRDGQPLRRIKDWTKRNDHRHHAMDALTIAFTKRSIIQYLNNMNARSDKSGSIYGIQQNELVRDSHNKLRFKLPFGEDNEFRAEAKKQLESIIVSQKAKNKVMTSNVNITRKGRGDAKTTLHKAQLTPRGQLHNETIYGSSLQYVTHEERVNASFDAAKIATVANAQIRQALTERLHQFGDDPKKAFTGNNTLDKNPIFLNKQHTAQIPIKVKVVGLEVRYTIRKAITPDLKLDKVVDTHIRQILQSRLDAYHNDAKAAFSNLDQNPIWLNKERGIAIKRVTISGVNTVTALHDKHNNEGQILVDSEGHTQPADFVSTSNNHHAAIFRDADGNLQEHVVSFYEAAQRASDGLPIIDKEYNLGAGWTFLYTMKQNEYFVFPNPGTGFNPEELNLLDPNNYELISPNLFRVQRLSPKDYVFRHHLETTVENVAKELKNITWKRIQSLPGLMGAVKVRVNHIGQSVSVG